MKWGASLAGRAPLSDHARARAEGPIDDADLHTYAEILAKRLSAP